MLMALNFMNCLGHYIPTVHQSSSHDDGFITVARIITIGLAIVANGSVKKMPIIYSNRKFFGRFLSKTIGLYAHVIDFFHDCDCSVVVHVVESDHFCESHTD